MLTVSHTQQCKLEDTHREVLRFMDVGYARIKHCEH